VITILGHVITILGHVGFSKKVKKKQKMKRVYLTMFYLTENSFLPIFIPLGFIGAYRWLWYIVKLIAYFLYRPIKPALTPKYRSKDVTILVPTIDNGEETKAAVRSWLANNPYEIIFITTDQAREGLEALAKEFNNNSIRVLTISKPNKRNQLVKGINHAKTPIVILCDDDAIWPDTMVDYLLAPFQDPQMGGVGTSQEVFPVGKRMTIWEILAAYRVSMRNIEITATLISTEVFAVYLVEQQHIELIFYVIQIFNGDLLTNFG